MGLRQHRKNYNRAMTLIELIIAMGILVIIFSVVAPQFHHIQKSWAAKEKKVEVVQNGRVVVEHIFRHISQAVQITAVSESTDVQGYIEYLDNDGNNYRYSLADGYIQFGLYDDETSELADLGGTIDSLTFTCYIADDYNEPSLDCENIRLVEIELGLTSPEGESRVFNASAYRRANSQDVGLVGHWKLNETGGDIAYDFCQGQHHAVLNNIPEDNWVEDEVMGRCLNIPSGTDHFLTLSSHQEFDTTGDFTMCLWIKTDFYFDYRLIFGNIDFSGQDGGFQFDMWAGFVMWWLYQGQLGTIEHMYHNYTDAIWHHLAFSVRSGVGHMYVDGVEAQVTCDVPVGPGGNLTVGTANGPNGREDYFGLVDDIRFYNRGLTTDEIQNLSRMSGVLRSKNPMEVQGWWGWNGYEVPPGLNRLLVITAHASDFNPAGIGLATMEFGGQEMEKVVDYCYGDGSGWNSYASAFILREADLQKALEGMESGTRFNPVFFTPGWESDHTYYWPVYQIFCLRNVNQDDPISDTALAGVLNGTEVNLSGLTTAADGMAFVVGTASIDGNFTMSNGFIKDYEMVGDNNDSLTGYKKTTGDPISAGFVHTPVSSEKVGVAFSVNPLDAEEAAVEVLP